MVENYSFLGSGKLIFGSQRFRDLPSLAPLNKAALICGNSFLKTEQYQEIKSSIKYQYTITGEPGPDVIDNIVSEIKGSVDYIVAVGGGSSLDAGKAVAAMCCSEGSVEDFLEGVGTKQPNGKTLPMVAVPTTAGTGSEATKNAVICRRGPEGYKKSLRHDNYIPSLVIIDPELYLTCPSQTMASCGMDAFSQLLEAYISTGANSYTDTLAWKGLTLFLENFPALIRGEEGKEEAMGKIAFAAYLSGICLANAGLGTIHGIAGPLGGYFDIPHGTACGTLLPEIMKRTVERNYVPKLEKLGRFIQEKNLLEESFGPAETVIKLLENWLEELRIPALSQFGITEGDVEKITAASGNKNHPVPFSKEEIASVIRARL